MNELTDPEASLSPVPLHPAEVQIVTRTVLIYEKTSFGLWRRWIQSADLRRHRGGNARSFYPQGGGRPVPARLAAIGGKSRPRRVTRPTPSAEAS